MRGERNGIGTANETGRPVRASEPHGHFGQLLRASCMIAWVTLGCASDDDPCPLRAEWLRYVQDHAQALSTIEPSATSEADLAFLEPILADRRIVGLGESSHGVAEYSRVKTRLVKYLHEKLGYDVLAFETSIVGAYLANEQTAELAATDLVNNALPSIWHTEDVVGLFEYVKATRATSHPLAIAGIDLEFTSADDATRRPQLFREVIERYDPVYAVEVETTDRAVAQHLWNKWRTVFVSDADARWMQDNATTLESFYRNLAKFFELHLTELENAYAKRPFLPSVLWRAAWGMQAVMAANMPNAGLGAVYRDRFLGATAAFVANEMFAKKKIMIWAHDSHLFKAGSDGVGQHMGYRDMGQDIAERFGDDYYMISLLMDHGTASDGVRHLYDIAPAPIGTIEGLLRTVHAPCVFLDLSRAPSAAATTWMDSEFAFRDFGLSVVRAVPRAQMDGVLYVDAVTPPVFFDP